MLAPKLFDKLFSHQLEEPRSILCFHAAWPIAFLLVPLIVVDWMAGQYVSVAVETAAMLLNLVMPAMFKTEAQISRIRHALVMVLAVAFVVALTTRMDSPIGFMWLPLFPFFVYILVGPDKGHWVVGGMLISFFLLAPFEQLGVAVSVMFAGALLISTVVANKYEMTLSLYHDKLQQLAERDELTGTSNRRATLAFLNRLTLSDQAQPLSILMLDIDNFKALNDTHGHRAGDLALAKVGALISRQLRAGQLAGRWGGDEFIVVLPHVDSAVAEQDGQRLRNNIKHDGGPAVSMGLATRHPSESIDALIHRADQALYEAKSRGRDRLQLATVHELS